MANRSFAWGSLVARKDVLIIGALKDEFSLRGVHFPTWFNCWKKSALTGMDAPLILKKHCQLSTLTNSLRSTE